MKNKVNISKELAQQVQVNVNQEQSSNEQNTNNSNAKPSVQLIATQKSTNVNKKT